MRVLGSDLGHHIRLCIYKCKNLNIVVLVEQCLEDTFKQSPATCALLSFLELWLYQI